MEQNRFKSWALWLAVAGAVWVIMQAFGIAEWIGVTSEQWNVTLNAIGAILIAFGIVNNPTSKDSL